MLRALGTRQVYRCRSERRGAPRGRDVQIEIQISMDCLTLQAGPDRSWLSKSHSGIRRLRTAAPVSTQDQEAYSLRQSIIIMVMRKALPQLLICHNYG